MATTTPRELGDRGQRYEFRQVRADGRAPVWGWAEDPLCALAGAVAAHPDTWALLVIDRRRAGTEGLVVRVDGLHARAGKET